MFLYHLNFVEQKNKNCNSYKKIEKSCYKLRGGAFLHKGIFLNSFLLIL